MDLEQAIELVNHVMVAKFDKPLNDVETAIFIGAWNNQTYEQIAETSGYSISYIRKHVGAQFWKRLSDALGETVSKTNFRAALERSSRQKVEENKSELTSTSLSSSSFSPSPVSAPSNSLHIDWGEAIDVSIFYGRTKELETLQQWIVNDRCRLLALLGMGGIGKSSLAAKIAQQLQNQFEFVIWRSLRNAPPAKTLLSELVPFLSHQQDTQAKAERLLYWLRTHRCLIILDNVETILQAGSWAGYYQSGYESYGDLFRLVGESPHQSCILLTSREKPTEVSMMESLDAQVRSLPLSGSQEAAVALLATRELVGTSAEKEQLCQFYAYSPLALKIAASSIQSLFDGNIASFLKEETMVFNGIRRLLEQQFERLSDLEQTIMYWLAVNREWVSMTELIEDIIPTVSRAKLLESLESLNWRSLIEKRSGYYTQQPVVMEYVTDCLIKQITTELQTAELNYFLRYALLKTTVKEYVHESQVRLILQPIVKQLQSFFSSLSAIEQQILRILMSIRRAETQLSGYSCGNLLNLCRYLQIDLTGYDFSNLTIRHAYLQQMNLRRVNLAHARLINSEFTHTLSSVFAVTFSPDGTLLATGESTGEIHLWRIADAQPVFVLKGHENRVLSVCFSPDGSLLASVSADCTIKLWNVSSGHLITTLEGHTNGVCSVSFSADQTMLASSGMDYTIVLWDLFTHQPIHIFKDHTNWVWAVCFSPLPGTKLLASGSADATIKLWDTESRQLLQTLKGHTDRIWSLCFSPDARLLASASEDHTVKLWDVATGQLLNTFTGHGNIVWSVSFSANGALLASGSCDQTVRIWEVATGQLLRTLVGHSNRVWSVEFSPVDVSSPADAVNASPNLLSGGTIVASGSADCTVKFWDVESGQLIKTIQGYTNGVRSIDFNANGSMLISGTAADHAIKLWDVKSGQLLKTLQSHTGAIHSVRTGVTATGTELIASGSSDQTVKLWHIQTGNLLQTLQQHTDVIWSVSISPEGAICASAGADYTIRLWDLATGQLLKTLQDHEGWVWSVCFSPDGKLLASGSGDSTVKLWEVETGQILKTLQGHTAWVRSVTFSPDGKLIASGSADCTVKLWEVQSEQLQQTLQGHTSWIWEVSFSPDGTQLASSSTDRTVKLWTVSTGHLLNTLQGHTSEVWAVRFSPQGNWLVSSGADETVRIWDANTGNCLQVLRDDRPYEAMNIMGITGLTEAQTATLKALGAIEQA